MELIDLLKSRFQIAQSFTKPFHEDVKKALAEYNPENKDIDPLDAEKRYNFKVPYIMSTHESMLSSMFDRVPELIFKSRGQYGDETKQKVVALYEYLKDVADLEAFQQDAAWWYLLTGMIPAEPYFKQETTDVPVLDEMGMPMVDETGEPMMRTDYVKNEPAVDIPDPTHLYFSPESKFTTDGTEIPYYFKKELLRVEEVKNIYGKKVQPDAEVTTDDKVKDKDDIQRVAVYFYYGIIPEANKKDVSTKEESWEEGARYYIVYANKEILHIQRISEEYGCKFGGLFGAPTEFFKFGFARLLSGAQKELNIRRNQELRYADLMAYPKLLYQSSDDIDESAATDPRITVALGYKTTPPSYLVPPTMPETVVIAEQKAREDAQFTSGLLDLSKGAQSAQIVKTATGQSIFNDAMEKRVRQAKRKFYFFFREVVVSLFILCQKNWTEEQFIEIFDEDTEQMIRVEKQDFASIDFDKDVDIDVETPSVNKEVFRAQTLEMLQTFVQYPFIDAEALTKYALKDAFNVKNPEQFIRKQEPMDAQAGLPAGNPMSTSDGVPTSESGILGNTYAAK